MRTCSVLAFFAITMLSALVSPAAARNVFEDVWRVATDPLKLAQTSSELSASVERTLLQLSVLESRINYDVQQRLEQIRSIIRDATVDATKQMLALEAQINADAIRLLYRAQCAVEVALMDQLQRSFVQLIANLKKANPRINILGIRIVDLDINDIKIDHPDQAYISTKTAQLNLLKNTVTDKSKAWDILSAYQNLERAARFTRCYYIDQGLETRWIEEVNELERLSLPWITIVKPTM